MPGERESAVVLRPAVPADAAAVADIWFRGWRDGHVGNVPDSVVEIRTEASFGVRAGERVGDTTVAVVDGAVVGFVMVVGDEVEQVFVEAAHRGAGVAGVLLAEAERLVGGGGHSRAWLAVVPGNVRARRFYARCGWVDEGPFEHHAAAGVVVRAHRYVKPVGGGSGSHP
ncbi:GNAT family N-acetyltransferase [Umezawaea endophytica]|uniref:GNAT family N-acetyltransferase n=1 Tax=Umezawaea endophytica TaxID=1654476 RepID=A0A9X3A6Z6_9PSEU|nr:GNAT family N-acetyltransferase [Umezawaea endophytica]MCS7483868.1 GNAT family N-acetyltransferase [Umezawaea endophytica]